MGLISSKFLKGDGPDSPPTRKGKIIVHDPRSPTGEINRTPIVVEKKPYLETNLDDSDFKMNSNYRKSQPLRTKLLRGMLLDPRSPTIGIERTPIVINEESKLGCCDSPVSIYSSNFIDGDSLINVTAPPDPSFANVSGFEDSQENIDPCMLEGVDVKCAVEDNKDTSCEDLEVSESSYEESIMQLSNLKVFDKPNTIEAQRLLKEITQQPSDSDFVTDEDSSLKLDTIPDKTPVKSVIKIQDKVVPTKIIAAKGLSVPRTRTPLSNITSSANSPSQVNSSKGALKKPKIMVDLGIENTGSPSQSKKGRHVALWDQDATVLI